MKMILWIYKWTEDLSRPDDWWKEMWLFCRIIIPVFWIDNHDNLVKKLHFVKTKRKQKQDVQEFPKNSLLPGSFNTPGDEVFRSRDKLWDQHSVSHTHITAQAVHLHTHSCFHSSTVMLWATQLSPTLNTSTHTKKVQLSLINCTHIFYQVLTMKYNMAVWCSPSQRTFDGTLTQLILR